MAVRKAKSPSAAAAVRRGKAEAGAILAIRAKKQRTRARAIAAKPVRRRATAAAPVRRAIPKRTLAAIGPQATGVLIAEGDSWFDYPMNDVLEALEDNHGFDVESVAHAGDNVEDMAYSSGQFEQFARRLEKLLARTGSPTHPHLWRRQRSAGDHRDVAESRGIRTADAQRRCSARHHRRASGQCLHVSDQRADRNVEAGL